MFKKLVISLPLMMISTVSFASYHCVGEKFDFSLKATEEENEYIGSIISKNSQLLLRVVLNEGELTEADQRQFKTAFAGQNSAEKFTLYVGKTKNSQSYLNIERNLGGNSTYQMICRKAK